MSKFLGGSAYAMVRDIGEGYFAVTDRSFKGMSAGEMTQLAHEMDRHLREMRGAQLPTDENSVVQARNRRIQRVNSALTMLRNFRQRTRT